MRANNIFTKTLKFALEHMTYTMLTLGFFSILLTYLIPAWIVSVLWFTTAFSLSMIFENIRYQVVETGCKLCRIQHNSLFDGKQRFIFGDEDDED